MNKPFSIIYEEFRQELMNLINNSKLPPFIIESVLQNYLNEVHSFAKNQYNLDKKRYEESLSVKVEDDKEEISS